MPRFGRNPFPRSFGGGPRVVEEEHEALLDELAPGWDADESTAHYVETYAHALAISMIWGVNERLKNESLPAKMIDNLPVYEAACRIRVDPSDSLQARRRAVAAKLRGLANNRIADIYDACAALLGSAFIGLSTATESDTTTYWPGVNPGPPGFEWCSNRAVIAVQMSRSALGDADFARARARTAEMLDGLIPAEMSYAVGVGSEFIVNEGIVGVTLI